jgi:hypothetical protein
LRVPGTRPRSFGDHGPIRPLPKPGVSIVLFFSIWERSGATGALSWTKSLMRTPDVIDLIQKRYTGKSIYREIVAHGMRFLATPHRGISGCRRTDCRTGNSRRPLDNFTVIGPKDVLWPRHFLLLRSRASDFNRVPQICSVSTCPTTFLDAGCVALKEAEANSPIQKGREQ